MNKRSKFKDLKAEKELIFMRTRFKKFSKTLAIVLIIFVLLVFRLAWIQFINGSSLKEQAYKQQVANATISAKRGTIYDSTGKVLAISAQVDTVSINPGKVKYSDDTPVEAEKLATIFSTIFELDYEETLSKINSNSPVVTIASKQEKDKIDLLKSTLKENEITAGINIDSDTKRYYPYDNLASSLIGFYGTDKGLEGIEARWDDILSGTSGKKIISTDSSSREIPNSEQSYIPAQNGSNITLTIDVNIQTIVEKYLSQAVTENHCARGGTAIIMQPSTGDILAMATYPDYNLNDPFEVDTSVWRNKVISNTYEPGSTFKVINAAIALEENLVDTDTKNFVCNGHEQFEDGTKINCWRYYAPHGSQSLREALENSCNPAFMQLGKKVGISTLYKYYKAFGLFNTTNIALYGEANSIFHNINTVGPVELATISFGQRFTITPLQLVTAISAIANDGVLMQPRIVKEIENTDTGSVTVIETTAVRQVVSKETSLKVLDLMESVVEEGTGQYGAVKGYTIGGKTGTSEPDPSKPEEGKTISYVAVAPTSNPELVILVTLYQPVSGEGGSTVGPVVSQILNEVLPYMGVASSGTSASDNTSNTTSTLIDVRGKTVSEARKLLKSYGFDVKYTNNGEIESKTIVTDQVPKPGVKLLSNYTTVCLYSEESNTKNTVTVPNLKGQTLAAAANILKAKNLNITFDGTRCSS